MHAASNLHYDLRLEIEGVLWSWTVPKGLPSKKGEKRLAIRTEDHPLKYLNFQGEIPAGEYGGGSMWIFDRGTYEVSKMKDTSIYFTLKGKHLKASYKIYKMKEDQWLMELDSGEEFDAKNYLEPMLARQKDAVPSGEYLYEIKWDGLRALIVIEGESLKIFSRNGNEITAQFPQLQVVLNHVEATTAVLDGEIVYLDEAGKPDFARIVGRLHQQDSAGIKHAVKHTPAVLYLFDLLYLDGMDTRTELLEQRKVWLNATLTSGDRVRLSEVFEDGKALFTAIENQGMEGIIAKKKSGKYRSGSRSYDWVKVKVRKEATAYIIGFTKGEGTRNDSLGALHLGLPVNDKWRYMGKVGTGFTESELAILYEQLQTLEVVKKPVKARIAKPRSTVWVAPIIQVEIEYASLSSNGTYREPVFKRIHT